MNFLKSIKYLFFLLLTFLLGAQPTHAKTEVITPTYQKVFVQTATIQPTTLKKVIQPNVGFLSRKLSGETKFVEGVSALSKCVFSEGVVGKLANARGRWSDVIYTLDDIDANGFHAVSNQDAQNYINIYKNTPPELRTDEQIRLFDYLAEGVDDLFSSFVHLKNLPIEAKTLLSAKNWDNALLTKVNGDLVNAALKNGIDANPQLIDLWKRLADLGRNQMRERPKHTYFHA